MMLDATHPPVYPCIHPAGPSDTGPPTCRLVAPQRRGRLSAPGEFDPATGVSWLVAPATGSAVLLSAPMGVRATRSPETSVSIGPQPVRTLAARTSPPTGTGGSAHVRVARAHSPVPPARPRGRRTRSGGRIATSGGCPRRPGLRPVAPVRAHPRNVAAVPTTDPYPHPMAKSRSRPYGGR